MDPSFFEKLAQFKDTMMTQANTSNDNLLKNIILIDLAALALLGAFLTKTDSDLLAIEVLLTIAISSFSFSILFTILEFINSSILFSKAHNELEKIIDKLNKTPVDKQVSVYKSSSTAVSRSTSKYPYLLSLFFFTLGISTFLSVVITKIWT